MRAIMASCSLPRSRVISRPPIFIDPESGLTIPSILLIITDFPVPEPPMTTSDRPFGTEIVIPFRTCFGPKAFRTPLRTMWAFSLIGASSREEDGRECEIRREYQDIGTHDGICRR